MTSDHLVYAPVVRRRLRWAVAILTAIAVSLPCAVAAVLLQELRVAAHLHVYAALGAAVATVGALAVVTNRLPLLGNGWLRRRVKAKVASSEEGAEFVREGVFVGFSPCAELMRWHGESDWDVGILRLVGDVIAFWGDRSRWAVPRDAVRGIELDETAIPHRVLISWRVGPGESGTAAIVWRDGDSVSASSRGAAKLLEQIEAWAKLSDGEPGPRWSLPPTGPMDGVPIGRVTGWGCLGALAVLGIAVVTWLLVGLPAYNAGLGVLSFLYAAAVGLPALVLMAELLPAETG